MADIPYELMHLPKILHETFDDIVPQAKSGTNEQKDVNFLTRALAAFTIQKITGCEKDVAANSVVDSGNDGGVDAAYFSEPTNTLWLVQSKYDQSGLGQPELQGITRFKTGLEQILGGDFTEIEQSEGWKPKIQDLKIWLSKPGLQIKVIVVYSSLALLSDDRVRLFENLKLQFNNDDNFIEFKSYGLTSVHDWITGRDKGVGVEKVDLEILNPGWFKAPHETIYGKIKFSSLVKLIKDHGAALVAANIRRYKGRSDVNEQIAKTVTTEPENLFYLNNGLTAYCSRLEVNNIDRNNSAKKRITAHGFCIVNGAQTLGSIGDACQGIEKIPENGEVFIKIVSLERCEDEREFAKRITESTNRQIK